MLQGMGIQKVHKQGPGASPPAWRVQEEKKGKHCGVGNLAGSRGMGISAFAT